MKTRKMKMKMKIKYQKIQQIYRIKKFKIY